MIVDNAPEIKKLMDDKFLSSLSVVEFDGNFHDYSVKSNPDLRIPDLDKSEITPNVYRYLEAYNLAVTLAAIGSNDFPGSTRSHSIYPFEYASQNRLNSMEEAIINLVLENQTLTKLHLCEIGGQQGGFLNSLQSNFKRKGVDIKATIIDLDYYRRQSGLSENNGIEYVQADAHNIQRLVKDKVINRPEIIMSINALGVIFDPISILKQAWDILPENGLIIIGDSFFSCNQLPVTVFKDGQPTFNSKMEDKLKESYFYWLDYNKRALLPGLKERNNFSYQSQSDKDSQELAILTRIFTGMSKLLFWEVGANMQTVFKKLVNKTYHYKSGTSQEAVFFALVKGNESNPFDEFKVDGIIANCPSIGEFAFPQVHRRIDI